MASGYSDLSEIRRDGRTPYGLAQKPPKINLLNEKPRRESLIEQQLQGRVVRQALSGQQLGQQQVGGTHYNQVVSAQRSQQPYPHANQVYARGKDYYYPFSDRNTRSGPSNHTFSGETSHMYNQNFTGGPPVEQQQKVTTTTTTRSYNTIAAPEISSQQQQQSYAEIMHDLADKETKLKREMAYLNEQLSPWSRPRQIREPRREPPPRQKSSNEQKWTKECPSDSASRPISRASSTKSTTEADLLEKAAKLLQDVEEIERKPFKTQQVLIENSAVRRSPAQQTRSQSEQTVSSIQTAIIKVPRGEIDNKSPLPFAFDNLSTLGVRGNIASVGAAPPESPYPPIFPIVKRTPSPSNRRQY